MRGRVFGMVGIHVPQLAVLRATRVLHEQRV
jgi:hypothetical protein